MNVKSNAVKIWVGVGACVLSAATAIATPVRSVDAELDRLSVTQSEIPVEKTANATGFTIAQGGEGDGKPEFVDKLSGAQLVSALRQGGYIIFFRHAQTEKDYADQVSAVMGKCDTQRMLSEEGWKQSRMIGEGFEKLKLPVGKVYSSEYCRAWQTADLAFGRYEKVTGLNFPKAEEYTEAQKAQMRSGIMPMLTALPAAGTNTVIVGHDDVFDAATGIYPEPQGMAYILKPTADGKFDIVANMLPDEWLKLPR
ncbi:MAG: histidine phosphatase family protein [Microcoleus sp. CSU_2_2]|nr:histidine phosphatase family protein [Microcoleus sp. SU_5_3]NJS11748.1 histidine phosphatase family protein [Microcoleus sp. CSU_2_2]